MQLCRCYRCGCGGFISSGVKRSALGSWAVFRRLLVLLLFGLIWNPRELNWIVREVRSAPGSPPGGTCLFRQLSFVLLGVFCTSFWVESFENEATSNREPSLQVPFSQRGNEPGAVFFLCKGLRRWKHAVFDNNKKKGLKAIKTRNRWKWTKFSLHIHIKTLCLSDTFLSVIKKLKYRSYILKTKGKLLQIHWKFPSVFLNLQIKMLSLQIVSLVFRTADFKAVIIDVFTVTVSQMTAWKKRHRESELSVQLPGPHLHRYNLCALITSISAVFSRKKKAVKPRMTVPARRANSRQAPRATSRRTLWCI